MRKSRPRYVELLVYNPERGIEPELHSDSLAPELDSFTVKVDRQKGWMLRVMMEKAQAPGSTERCQ